MATPVIMPRQGQSVESCIITKWHKAKGDKVKEGDLLFSYETDKASFDEEAKVEGTLLEIFFDEGDDVPVLTNVCVIGNEGENVSEFRPGGGADTEEVKASESKEVENAHTEQKEQAAQTEQTEEKVAAVIPGNQSADGRLKISPRARNLADRTGVDPRFVPGTGPDGRIIERDILAAQEKDRVFARTAEEDGLRAVAAQSGEGTGVGAGIAAGGLRSAPTGEAASAPDYVEVKLPNIRKVIAKAMHHSLSSTAQLTLNTSFDATDILAYRKKLKEGREKLGLEKITINDIILYAVSRTILNHKELNAHFLDDTMRIFNNVHLGIAVDTPRGLLVPTLFHANLKSLNEISKEAKALAEACQNGTVSPDVLKGASFTITNLGTLDIESFTPVLNPPQTGILGVNTIVQRVKEVNGEYVYYPAMGLSLTFDHRALDGAPAARFLKDLKNNLENFSVLLAK